MTTLVTKSAVVKMLCLLVCCFAAAFKCHALWLEYFMARLGVRRWDDAALAEKRGHLIWSVGAAVIGFNLGWIANKFLLKLVWALLWGHTTSDAVEPTALFALAKAVFVPTSKKGLLTFGILNLVLVSLLNITFALMGTQKTAMTRDLKHFIAMAGLTGGFYVVPIVLVLTLLFFLLLKWCVCRKSSSGNSPSRYGSAGSTSGSTSTCCKPKCLHSFPDWMCSRVARFILFVMLVLMLNMFFGPGSSPNGVSGIIVTSAGEDGVLPNMAMKPHVLLTLWNSIIWGKPDPRPYQGVIETWDMCKALKLADGKTDPSFMTLWADVLPRRWINFFTGSEVCPLLEKDPGARFSHFDDYSQLLLVPEFCAGDDKKKVPKVALENPAVNALTDMKQHGASRALTLENVYVNEAWQRLRDGYQTHPLKQVLVLHDEQREVDDESPIPAPAVGGDEGKKPVAPTSRGIGLVEVDVEKFTPLSLEEVEKALATSGAASVPEAISKWIQKQTYPTEASKKEVTDSLFEFIRGFREKYGETTKLRALPLLSGFVSVDCGSLSEYHSHPWQLGRSLGGVSSAPVKLADAVPPTQEVAAVATEAEVEKKVETDSTKPVASPDGETTMDPTTSPAAENRLATAIPPEPTKVDEAKSEKNEATPAAENPTTDLFAADVKEQKSVEPSVEVKKETLAAPAAEKSTEETAKKTEGGAEKTERRGMNTQQSDGKTRNKSVVPVLFIMIDALSKQAMRREYPATTAWLERRARKSRHTSGSMPVHTKFDHPETWVEFSGMTVMGHSTPQNMKPMLNGLPHNSPVALLDHKHYNIFKMIKSHDQETFNGMYTVSCSHTQHYTFFMSQKDLWHPPYLSKVAGFGGKNGDVDDDNWSQMCHIDYGPFEDVFFGPYSVQRRCIGKDYVHQLVLNHTLTSIRRHLGANRNFFHLLLHFEAHEGSHAVTTLMDADLVGFLDSLDRLGFFEKASLIIGGDHGSHTGPLFEWTLQGRYERTTPLMLMSLPPTAFEAGNEFPAVDFNVLKKNSKTLSTHIDTYATIVDLVGGNHGEKSKAKYGFTIGESLLRPLNNQKRNKNCTTANANVLCSATWCGRSVKVEEAQWVWPFANTTYTEKEDVKKKDAAKAAKGK